VKEDVESYLLGHAGKDVHAGYGEQWIKTLKRQSRSSPTAQASPCGRRKNRSAACSTRELFYFLGDEEVPLPEHCNGATPDSAKAMSQVIYSATLQQRNEGWQSRGFDVSFPKS
jgi:hypothetical protein